VPPENAVQQELNALPPHIQRLVIFQPDHGQLIYFIAGGQQMLFYSHGNRREKTGYCNNTANETWSVDLNNHGSNLAAARAEYAGFVELWRGRPGLKSQTRFEQASEGATFVFDTRRRAGDFLCGVYKTVTFFRIGGVVVMTSEEFRNQTPIEKPHLAQRLSGLLGWK